MKESMQTQTELLPDNEDFSSALIAEPDMYSAPVSDEDQHRSAAYSLLAALLRQPPDTEILQHVGQFAEVQPENDDLSIAMNMLGLSASSSKLDVLDDEFHALFIGLGRGELVPFGTWYQTGFLMERPLGILREDLKKLGYERDDGVHEPEDHIAALCEVMAMLILDGRSHGVQQNFFNVHLQSWVSKFFNDLVNADNASFYRSVGRFGLAFSAFEERYFSMQA
jgi:TorA maturation chaperone TorD